MKGATHRVPGLVLTDHTFDVPVDHARPDGPTIEVYAREVVSPGKERDDLPLLAFFQGGPGFGSPRPLRRDGWLERALEDYRVILLDGRGTARSTPAFAQTLVHLTPPAQADFLACFRADAIVRDAEIVRRAFVGDRPWSILGQSFGGFCAVTYLSIAPEGLAEVMITGGLPPLDGGADDVYRATYARVRERNRRYYERYPGDGDLVRDIVSILAERDVRLPDGDRLNPRRLLQLGLGFGMSDGFETVHYLLEEALVSGIEGPEPSDTFLRTLDFVLPYATHPIFSILHEAAYCQGAASQWAAERVRTELGGFEADEAGRPLFTGEMIYPWMFEDYGTLRPLQEAAHILAERDDWPALYDIDRLASNDVPCAAAVYAEDMYVERAFSEETAAHIGGIRAWVTNEHDHNGLRADGETILGRLLDMLRGEA